MVTNLVDGHLVDEETTMRVAALFDRATKLRYEADVENALAKEVLAAQGIRSVSVVTERAALLLMRAQRATDEAMRLIDSCPAQLVADETWTG
jgi:hypothetical protein